MATFTAGIRLNSFAPSSSSLVATAVISEASRAGVVRRRRRICTTINRALQKFQTPTSGMRKSLSEQILSLWTFTHLRVSRAKI